MARNTINKDPNKLRSRKWFANPENPDMTALYLERYMNFGLTREDGLVMDVLHNYGNASIEAGFLLGVLVNSRASARELAALRRQLSLE